MGDDHTEFFRLLNAVQSKANETKELIFDSTQTFSEA
jgi:hypothetical protein